MPSISVSTQINRRCEGLTHYSSEFKSDFRRWKVSAEKIPQRRLCEYRQAKTEGNFHSVRSRVAEKPNRSTARAFLRRS